MGQYYYPILIEENGTRHHFDKSINGNHGSNKLTEHSWWKNPTMAKICCNIYKEPMRVFWVGDYCKSAPSVNELTREEMNQLYEDLKLPKESLFSFESLFLDGLYLVNYSKCEYIDCDNYRSHDRDNDGWVVHPLSILTAVGNGQGCGDYSGTCMDYVGAWAGDIISVEDAPPENFKRLDVYFTEKQGGKA